LILTHTAFEAALALHEASSEAIEAVLALSRGYLQLKNHRSDLRLVLSFLDTALRLGRKEEALRVARNSLRVLEKMGPDAERYRPCLLLRLIKGLLGGERTVRSESVCMWSEEDVRNRDLLLEQVESIRARGKAGERKPLDVIFQRLFVNVMLEQLYQAEYSQLIPDMVECYKQFTQQEKSRSDERPLPVLLDVVLIVLRTSSKTLRDASIQLMGDVCGEMEEEDVREIMEVFWKDEGLEESEEEKKESEEEMEMEMDESGEEEEESSEESEEEEEEESEEENSEWEEGVGFLGVFLG